MGNVFHRHVEHVCAKSTEQSCSTSDSNVDFIHKVVEEIVDRVPEKSVKTLVASSSRSSVSNECTLGLESDDGCKRYLDTDTDLTEYESAADTDPSGKLSSSASLLTFSDQLNYEPRDECCSCSLSESDKKLECVCSPKLSPSFSSLGDIPVNNLVTKKNDLVLDTAHINVLNQPKSFQPFNVQLSETLSPSSSCTSPDVNNFVVVEEASNINVGTSDECNSSCSLDLDVEQSILEQRISTPLTLNDCNKQSHWNVISINNSKKVQSESLLNKQLSQQQTSFQEWTKDSLLDIQREISQDLQSEAKRENQDCEESEGKLSVKTEICKETQKKYNTEDIKKTTYIEESTELSSTEKNSTFETSDVSRVSVSNLGSEFPVVVQKSTVPIKASDSPISVQRSEFLVNEGSKAPASDRGSGASPIVTDRKTPNTDLESKASVFDVGSKVSTTDIKSELSSTVTEDKTPSTDKESKAPTADVESKVLPTDIEIKSQSIDVDSKGLPTDVESKVLPTDVDSKVLPTDVDSKVLPTDKSKVLPTDVGSKVLPTDVECKVLPTDIESKVLLTEVEGKVLPTDVEGKALFTEVESKSQSTGVESKAPCTDIGNKAFSTDFGSKSLTPDVGSRAPSGKEKSEVPADVESKASAASKVSEIVAVTKESKESLSRKYIVEPSWDSHQEVSRNNLNELNIPFVKETGQELISEPSWKSKNSQELLRELSEEANEESNLESVKEQSWEPSWVQKKEENRSVFPITQEKLISLHDISPVSALGSSLLDSFGDQSSSSCTELLKGPLDLEVERSGHREGLSAYVSENFSFVAAEASRIAEDIFNALEDLDSDDTISKELKMSSLGDIDSDVLDSNYPKLQHDQSSQNYFLDGDNDDADSPNSLRGKKTQDDDILKENSCKSRKGLEMNNSDLPSKLKDPGSGECTGENVDENTKSSNDLKKESLYKKLDNLVDVVSHSSPQSFLDEDLLETESGVDNNENTRESAQIDEHRNTPVKNQALDQVEKLLSFTSNPTPKNRSAASGDDSQLNESVNQKLQERLRQLREVILQQESTHKDEVKKYQRKMKYLEEKEQQLGRKMAENSQGQQQMSLILEEYEKTISRLVAEKEHERQSYDIDKENLIKEKDAISGHLSNIEIAFSDVHQKYEKSKQVIQGFKNNEEALRATVSDYETALKKQEQKYEILKSHAMGQLESANQELIAMRRMHEAENSKLKAMLKKAEIKIHSLEETLQQKIKENQELVNICDELIGKVGSNE